MILDLNLFTQAIELLQSSSLNDISNALQGLNQHHDLAVKEYNDDVAELRRLVILYKKYESQINYQKQNISDTQITPWIPVLKIQQSSTAFPDARATTVSNIISSKKEMDSLDASLEEMKLKVFAKGKDAKTSSDIVDKFSTQIFIAETAIDIVGKFNMMDYDVNEMAVFEIPKYYNLYRKGSG